MNRKILYSVQRLWFFRHLIRHNSWVDFRQESERNYLGMAWWLLDPIINTLIYFLVFGVFMRHGGADFLPHLVIGIAAWSWFSHGVTGASTSILQKVKLLSQVNMEKLVFPTSRICTATYKFAFSLVVVLCVLVLEGYTPTLMWLVYPLVLLVELAFICAVGFLLAAISPFFPDLNNLVNYALRMTFFLSGVMYKIEIIPEPAQRLLQFNPMVHLLEAHRDVLMFNQLPNFGLLAVLTLFSCAMAFTGIALIVRFSGLYVKRVIV